MTVPALLYAFEKWTSRSAETGRWDF